LVYSLKLLLDIQNQNLENTTTPQADSFKLSKTTMDFLKKFEKENIPKY